MRVTSLRRRRGQNTLKPLSQSLTQGVPCTLWDERGKRDESKKGPDYKQM